MNARTSNPSKTNKYYLKSPAGYNPCILGNPDNRLYPDSVLADCTGAAVGRFNELIGAKKCKYLGPGYPGDYMRYAKTQGLETGSVPRPGAVCVMLKADGKHGHVFCIEKVSGGRSFTFESGWNYRKGKYINNRWVKAKNNFGMSADYKLTGYIYNPNVDPYPVPPASFNTHYTKKGDYVKFVQWVLVKEKCYENNTPAEIDGSAGSRTIAAVKVYQAKHGLKIDGWAGRQTCGQMKTDHAII